MSQAKNGRELVTVDGNAAAAHVAYAANEVIAIYPIKIGRASCRERV